MSDAHSPDTARPTTIILRGFDGEFAEEFLVFRAGFAVGPFSLGRQGDWRVSAEGVANIHAYLWFDGLVLRAARLRGGPEAWIDQDLLREDWQQLPDGAALRVGAAKVVVSTRADATTVAEDSQGVAMTTQSAPPAADSATAAAWTEKVGLTKKGRFTLRAVLLGCSVPLAVLLWLVWTHSGHRRPKAAPAPSPQVSAQTVGTVGSPVKGSTPPVASDGEASPPAAPNDDESPEGVIATEQAAPSQRVQTLERRAVDAVLRGDFQGATEIYTELAVLVPSSQSFAVAKRVSTNKAGKSATGM